MMMIIVTCVQITYCIADSAGGGLSLQAVTPTQPMPEEEEVNIIITIIITIIIIINKKHI